MRTPGVAIDTGNGRRGLRTYDEHRAFAEGGNGRGGTRLVLRARVSLGRHRCAAVGSEAPPRGGACGMPPFRRPTVALCTWGRDVVRTRPARPARRTASMTGRAEVPAVVLASPAGPAPSARAGETTGVMRGGPGRSRWTRARRAGRRPHPLRQAAPRGARPRRPGATRVRHRGRRRWGAGVSSTPVPFHHADAGTSESTWLGSDRWDGVAVLDLPALVRRYARVLVCPPTPRRDPGGRRPLATSPTRAARALLPPTASLAPRRRRLARVQPWRRAAPGGDWRRRVACACCSTPTLLPMVRSVVTITRVRGGAPPDQPRHPGAGRRARRRSDDHDSLAGPASTGVAQRRPTWCPTLSALALGSPDALPGPTSSPAILPAGARRKRAALEQFRRRPPLRTLRRPAPAASVRRGVLDGPPLPNPHRPRPLPPRLSVTARARAARSRASNALRRRDDRGCSSVLSTDRRFCVRSCWPSSMPPRGRAPIEIGW